MNDFKLQMLDYELRDSDTPYLEEVGIIPVILTAPHTMKQHREDGSVKLSEPFTKAIAMYVANEVEASYLIKVEDTGVDANSLEDEEFKSMLVELINKNHIKLVLDIHGAKSSRDFDVEFGTLNNLSADFSTIRELEDAFKENGVMGVRINDPFKGGGISQAVYANTDIDVIQIEINAKFRNINNEEGLKRICDALVQFIKQYHNCVSL